MESYAAMSDEELVRDAVSTGNSELFDRVIRRHLPNVYALVYSMVLNHADADELVQDAFLRAYRNLAGFKQKSSFSTWLHRIAVNVVRDHQRRDIRNPVIAVEQLPPRAARKESQPDKNMEGRELDAAIRHALETLSPRLRVVIVYSIIDGMSVSRIAKIEGCSKATVYWRIHAARKQLKRVLQQYF